jgi:hypothetical protein
MSSKLLCSVLISLTLVLAAKGQAANAPASVAGTYANLSFNVDGAGGQNRLMPRLELRADQTYRWGRESGTYEYRDGRIYLSGSYSSWGPGRVDEDGKIWFEFTKGGKRYTVTMYRVSE